MTASLNTSNIAYYFQSWNSKEWNFQWKHSMYSVFKTRLLSHKDGWQTNFISVVIASIQPPISILTCLRYFYKCTSFNTSFPPGIFGICFWLYKSGLPSFTCKTDIISIPFQSSLNLNFCTGLAYSVFVFTTKDSIPFQSTLNFRTVLAYLVFVFTTKERIRDNTETIQPVHGIIFFYWLFLSTPTKNIVHIAT